MDRRDCLKRFAGLGACSAVLPLLLSGDEKLAPAAPGLSS